MVQALVKIAVGLKFQHLWFWLAFQIEPVESKITDLLGQFWFTVGFSLKKYANCFHLLFISLVQPFFKVETFFNF
jgi:hypothetical protein